MWLIDQPEILSTINLIPSAEYHGIPLTFIVGLFAMFFIIILCRKLSALKLILLIMAFWLPLYANAAYNASYDLIENFSYFELNLSKKRVLRLCNMDHRQDLNNNYCQLYSFFIQVRKILPKDSTLGIAAAPGMETFFYYYLFPDYKFSEALSAGQLLLYLSANYRFEDGVLYQRGKDLYGSDEKKIGNYLLRGSVGSSKLMLEKNFNDNILP